MSTVPGAERKVSIYISLGIIGAIAIVDLVVNKSLEASGTILLALIGYAGGRQILKSTLGK